MQIRSVHYDLTDLCNAGCPQCARTDPDGCRPRAWLTNSVCSLEKFRRLSPPAFLAGLDSAYFCGNFGDPAVVPDLIDIVRCCFEAKPNLWLAMHTNASVRSVAWWRELAQATRGRPFRVIAGIDGTSQDSNRLYRVGTDFDRIMANLDAFVAEGGTVEWRMIVFAHNESEVETARNMAREHGFAGFRAYPSDRFGGRATFSYSRGDAVTVLEPPGGAFAPKLAGLRQIAPTEVDGANACIDCDALRSASAFITFEGFLLPCCYVGGRHYTHRHRGPVPADADIAAIFESFDMTVLDIEAVGFWAALQGYAAFMDHLAEHWPGQGPKVCKAVCGRRRTASP